MASATHISDYPLVDGKLQIIHENGMPYGIRDRTGFLFFFRPVSKFPGQEDRYRIELDNLFALAEFLLQALKQHEDKP